MNGSSAGSVTWILDVDSSKFTSGLDKSRRDIHAFAKDAEDSTNNISSSFGKSGSVLTQTAGAFGGAVATIAKVGLVGLATGAVAATTAMVGLGIKGISSANELQTLQLQMNGLTKSIDLGAQAMSGAYEFAKKSPFQLPDVAATTKTLLAFGMNVDQAVGNLELLGNISITTGVPIQALGGIFGRVSAQGRLMGGDIQQLTENGVAILPQLQKQLGKTSEEVRKMAENGQIDFATFKQAMGDLVDPTILEQMQNTLSRQMDRLGGSVRILSNAFVGVGVDATNGFRVASDGITQATTNLVKNLADQLRSPQITTAFDAIGKSLVPVINSVSALLQPLMGTIIAIATPIATLLSGLGGGLVSLLTAAMPGINAFFGALNQGFVVLGPILNQVGTVLGKGISDVLTALAPAIAPLAQTLAIIMPVLAQVISLVAVFAAQLVGALAPILPVIASALVSIVTPLINGLQPILPLIVTFISQLAQAFIVVLSAIMPIIPPLMQIVVMILQQIMMPLLPLITQLLMMFANIIMQVFQAIQPLLPQLMLLAEQFIKALVPILPTVVQLFIQLLAALMPLLPPLLQIITILLPPLIALLTIIIQVVGMLSNIMISVLVGALSMVIQIFGVLIGWLAQASAWFNNLAQMGSNAVTNLLNAVSDRINGVVNFFAGLPGRIVNAIGDMGSTLRGIGESIIQGFLNGITSKFSEVKNKLGELTKLIPDWKGPAELDKVLLMPNANLIMGGFIQGLESNYGRVEASLQGLTTDIQAPMVEHTTIGQSQNTAPNNKVNISLNMNGIMTRSRSDQRELTKDMLEAVNEELRARQLPEIGGGALGGASI